MCVAASLAAADEASAQAAAVPQSGITFVSQASLSPRLVEVTLRTPALAINPPFILGPNPTGQTKVRVLLPAGYDANGTRRYPVLYLFHGGGGNQSDWTSPAKQGKAEEITAGLPLIVVMPDGGVAGGYSDWFNGGAFGAPKWKTYHLDQLIPWIDARYRTIANRNGRATAGLSMGGGGLRYAEQRPDLIGATAAFSGDIDFLQPASDWHGAGSAISRLIWGDLKTQEVWWRGANGLDLAKNLANTNVALFTGDTGRPEATYIVQGTTATHKLLDELGIKHRFTLQPGMLHSWPTWNQALTAWLPDLMTYFRRANRANLAPAAFTYSTIAPSYAMYGWDVAVQRKAVEFSSLEVRKAGDFTLFGSGSATVRTPAIGRANAAYRVAIATDGKPGRTVDLRSDAAGRLVVPLDLGPANPFQQYSPEAKAAATGPATDKVPFRLFDNGSRFYRADVKIAAAGRR